MHCRHIIRGTGRPRVRHAASALIVAATMMSLGCSNERTLTVTATAFNSTRSQTDGRPSETACGDRLRPGHRIIAVSRDLEKQGLVCGTEVEISGLKGTWTVGDRMARRHNQRIDIYKGRDVKAARRWGVQEVEITWRNEPRSKSRVRVAEAER